MKKILHAIDEHGMIGAYVILFGMVVAGLIATIMTLSHLKH